jgi:hypothetical protein
MSLVSRILRAATAFAVVAVLAGCAHPINVGTDTSPPRVEANLIQKKVAYTMTDAQRALQAVTPGGGGDRISYYPYRDLEKSIRDALRAVYQDVVVLKSTADVGAVQASGASLVFTPEIKTDSGSPSPFTWPPTYFTTEVSCVVTDPSGAEITRVKASGRGEAEFSEFKGEFGLSAKRAATKVATELSSEIAKNDKLR